MATPSSSSPLTTLPSYDDPSAAARVEVVNDEAGPSVLPTAPLEELREPTSDEAGPANVGPDSFFAQSEHEPTSLTDTGTTVAAAAASHPYPSRQEDDAGDPPLSSDPQSSIPAEGEETYRPATSPRPPSPLPSLDTSQAQASSSNQQIGPSSTDPIRTPLPPDAEPPQEPQPPHAELSEGTDDAPAVEGQQSTASQLPEVDAAEADAPTMVSDQMEKKEVTNIPEREGGLPAADPLLESGTTQEPSMEPAAADVQASTQLQSSSETAPEIIPADSTSEVAAVVAGGSEDNHGGEEAAQDVTTEELASSAEDQQSLPNLSEATLATQEVTLPASEAGESAAVEVDQQATSDAVEPSVIETDAERQIAPPSVSAAEDLPLLESNATEEASGHAAATADATAVEPTASSQSLPEAGQDSKASVTVEPVTEAVPTEATAQFASQAADEEATAAIPAISEDSAAAAAALPSTISGTSDGSVKPSEDVRAAVTSESSQTKTAQGGGESTDSTEPTKQAAESQSAATQKEAPTSSENKTPSKEEARVSLVLSVNQELIRLCVDLQDKSASASAPPETMLRDISHRLQTNLAFLASMADKGRKANAETVNLAIPRLDMFPHASYRSDLEKLSPNSTLPKLYTQMAQAFAGLTRPVAPGFGGGPPSAAAGSTANSPGPERKRSRDESIEGARKKPALPNGHHLPRSSASPAPNAGVGFANPFANGTPPLATPPIRGSPGSVGSMSHPQQSAIATPARQSNAEQQPAVSPSNQLPPGMSPQQAQVLMQAFGPTALSTFSFLQSYLRSPQCKPQFAALPLAVQMQQIAGLAAQQKQRLAMAASQQQQQQQQQPPNQQLTDSPIGQQQMQHNAPGTTPFGDSRRQAPFHASSASPSQSHARASPGGGFMPPPPHPQSMGMPNGIGHHPGQAQAQAQAQRQASADLGRSSPASMGRGGGGGGGGTNASSPASMLRQSFGAGGAQTPPPPATGHTHVFNPFAATGHSDGQGAGGHAGSMAGSMLPPNGGMSYNGGAGGPNLNTNAAMMMAMAQQQQQQGMPGYPGGMNPQAFLAQQQQQGRQAPPGQNGQGGSEGLSTYQQLAQFLSQSQQHQQAAMTQHHLGANAMGPPGGNTPGGGAGGYAALNGGSAGLGSGMGINGSASAGFDSLPPHMQQFLAQQQQMQQQQQQQQHSGTANGNGNGGIGAGGAGGGVNNWSGANASANPAALMQSQENPQGYYPNGTSFDPSSMLSGGQQQQQQQQYGGGGGSGGAGGINPQALSGAMRGGQGQAWSQQTLWGDGGAAAGSSGNGGG
ncbi:hypothetical protein BCV69DRAFT_296223 [Microstroma glucosiphilum]|uniref:Uncharacterized protein n=1 Tax=Pseudomicrostroma glucosiphilum TaxID=1684307 RepID=A0A316UL13_9BASI|nr:hypothetical protein BCV69DRAFT_296223 [Pseudomicrostroma glucosiphilum]PWN23915.1 hypothetical protein BCV69DRAFT_296223 [Pseudomicrostroma glucosiphilum]